jgi:hypothetical protein
MQAARTLLVSAATARSAPVVRMVSTAHKTKTGSKAQAIFDKEDKYGAHNCTQYRNY